MRTFACYTVAYLVAATIVAGSGMALLMGLRDSLHASFQSVPAVNGGPYVYDSETGDLLPAMQMTVGEAEVFVGIRALASADKAVQANASATMGGSSRAMVSATLDMVKSDPALSVYDWGGNYTEEMYEEAGGSPYAVYASEPVEPSSLGDYDAWNRENRLRAPEADGWDFGPGAVVSNVGYYVSQNDLAYESEAELILRGASGLFPFAAYRVLAVLFFRRFYRKRLAAPLSALHAAADSIAEQNLDFSVGDVSGREFGKLAEAFERMRVSLGEGQRALWRAAEDRKRLNAAFAHDLRTPITVLKGTVEMMASQAEDGSGFDVSSFATLAGQVDRLERYVDVMARASKLDDRVPEPEPVSFDEFVASVEEECRMVVESCSQNLELDFIVPADEAPAGQTTDMSLNVDTVLVGEALGNLLSNACAHARSHVSISLHVVGGMLDIAVADDGEGFSAEALRRGCEPFYSEAKSSEHFGMGLNIASVLASLHGGDVRLTNLCEPERGACVHARFNVAAGAAGEDRRRGKGQG